MQEIQVQISRSIEEQEELQAKICGLRTSIVNQNSMNAKVSQEIEENEKIIGNYLKESNILNPQQLYQRLEQLEAEMQLLKRKDIEEAVGIIEALKSVYSKLE